MKIWMVALLALTLTQESKASTCGRTDDRKEVTTTNSAVGFLFDDSLAKDNNLVGCTVTLISQSCAISAGHCGSKFDLPESAGKVQFFIKSLEKAQLGKRIEYVFEVDRERSKVVYNRNGKDFSVIKLKENSITKLLPGDTLTPLKLANSIPRENDTLSIYGYGYQSRLDETGISLKYRQGRFDSAAAELGLIYHQIDTQPMDSGAAILNQKEEIVGVQNLGVCDIDSEDGNGLKNVGTLVTDFDFARAIQNCMR